MKRTKFTLVRTKFTFKKCCHCKQIKPLNEFSKSKNTKNGLNIACKICNGKQFKKWKDANREQFKYAHKKRHFKSKYNLTLEELNLMFIKQDNKCAICKLKMKKLVVDHNHSTGKIRGLLCNKCNTSLGGFNDNPRILQKAKMYLIQHK